VTKKKTNKKERDESSSFGQRLIDGKPYDFTYSGETYYLAQPTTEEFDDASFLQTTAFEAAKTVPEIKQLQDEESGVGVFANKADEVATGRGLLARDRYLTFCLLCDEDGKRFFDPNNEEDIAKWDKVPIGLKDISRLTIWQMIQEMNTVPFDLAALLEPKSALQSVSGNGRSEIKQVT
jgi:hypothetical protein